MKRIAFGLMLLGALLFGKAASALAEQPANEQLPVAQSADLGAPSHVMPVRWYRYYSWEPGWSGPYYSYSPYYVYPPRVYRYYYPRRYYYPGVYQDYGYYRPFGFAYAGPRRFFSFGF